MKCVELYGRVRHKVLIEGYSNREVARMFGIDPRTVAKMLKYSVPTGYRRTKPVKRPKLDGFTEIIDQILEDDKVVPKKQRHTGKRVFFSSSLLNGYDELKTLSYAILLICPICADVRQMRQSWFSGIIASIIIHHHSDTFRRCWK